MISQCFTLYVFFIHLKLINLHYVQDYLLVASILPFLLERILKIVKVP